MLRIMHMIWNPLFSVVCFVSLHYARSWCPCSEKNSYLPSSWDLWNCAVLLYKRYVSKNVMANDFLILVYGFMTRMPSLCFLTTLYSIRNKHLILVHTKNKFSFCWAIFIFIYLFQFLLVFYGSYKSMCCFSP